jgi:hypothetical protein
MADPVYLTAAAQAKLNHLIQEGSIIADKRLTNRYRTLETKGLIEILGKNGHMSLSAGFGITYTTWEIKPTAAGRAWKPIS